MTTTYSPASIWLLLGVIAAGTWAIRVSFIALFGRIETIPDWVLRILRLIPAAVLAALVAPALTHATGEFDLATARFTAGIVAGIVAWRTRNVLATIATGMASLWLLQALGL
jgi:branched-subunit amino acid transport protein